MPVAFTCCRDAVASAVGPAAVSRTDVFGKRGVDKATYCLRRYHHVGVVRARLASVAQIMGRCNDILAKKE